MQPVNTSLRVVSFKGITGEHHALLVDAAGLPDWWSTCWVVDKLRKAGQASNTIEAKLRAVQMLYMAVPQASDLSARLAKGQWLTAGEADHLLEQMAYPAQQIASFNGGSDQPQPQQNIPPRKKVVSLESARSKLKTSRQKTVNSQTKTLRLLFIREFLSWRANQHVLQMRGEKKAVLAKEIDDIDNYLESRTATTRSGSAHGSAKGLTDVQAQLLHEVIEPGSPRNVWKESSFIRSRNQLIVELCLLCGTRRGAVLGIQAADIDAMTGRITMQRRPDDRADSRVRQTGNKRIDYLIPIGHGLLTILKTYEVQRHKVMVKSKSRTPYLIVAETGQPLEQSSINYVVRSLRAIPELAGIHPHLLRHAWASNYVAARVANGEDVETIEADLRTLGGWSIRSEMPSHYTRHYREQRSFEASLRLQSGSIPLKTKRPKHEQAH